MIKLVRNGLLTFPKHNKQLTLDKAILFGRLSQVVSSILHLDFQYLGHSQSALGTIKGISIDFFSSKYEHHNRASIPRFPAHTHGNTTPHMTTRKTRCHTAT